MARRIAFVGCGALGRTLARALREAGYVIGGVACRSDASARAAVEFVGAGMPMSDPARAARDAEIVFIATPDAAIGPTCEALAQGGALRGGQTVLHCSGALGADVLSPARAAGAAIGALHPIQTFAEPAEALASLPGTWFSFDGDDAALVAAKELVAALRGRLFRLTSETKALYHAATVFASNYLVAVEHVACGLLVACGLESTEALEALMPLVRGTVRNLERVGLPQALTGPIARGDVETVEAHLAALGTIGADVRDLYCRLGRAAIEAAQAKGRLDAARARRLRAILSGRPATP